MKTRTAEAILTEQVDWAVRSHVRMDGYTRTVNDNLFLPLCDQSRAEFVAGKGQELGSLNRRGHMTALHSSSALVVNVFEYWRQTKRVGEIAQLLGGQSGYTDIEFEKTHPIPTAGRIPPHLDIEFSSLNNHPMAVESKFTETYHRKTRRPNEETNLEKYLAQNQIWSDLPKTKAVAEKIVSQSGSRTEYEYLDVPQLVKHILGLTIGYQKDFSLVYLWYRVESDEARKHQKELERLSNQIGDEITLIPHTYQDLFQKIKGVAEIDPLYTRYLEWRYFSR